MFVEYMTPQRVADTNITECNSSGGEYRPTWLVRTSDWQRVPGDEASSGYHALSYCWEQSGKIVPTRDGEYICINKDRHRLKVATESRSLSNLFRKYTTTRVTYDGILQQICKDFDIQYLWYDKICIDQTNKEEKKREIKQMHVIYSNARFTVAFVPEIYIDDPKEFETMNPVVTYTDAKTTAIDQMMESLWYKRSWTLEEVMMSTQIVVVGRNTHFWSTADIKQDKSIKENEILANFMLGFKERETKSANLVLSHAHFRTSTKEHDKIFALANIFHGIISIDVNYKSDVTAAMKNFYRRLAERDLSVMYFGSIQNTLFKRRQFKTTMASHNLPSWTGVDGLHCGRGVVEIAVDQNNHYSIDDSMGLHIRCRGYTVRPIKYHDYGVFIVVEREREAQLNYYKIITSMDSFDGDEQAALDWGQGCMVRSTDCYATHYFLKPGDNPAFFSPVLPLSLTENKCNECIILALVFRATIGTSRGNVPIGYNHGYYSPVVKKPTKSSTYEAIGVVLLKIFHYNEPRDSPHNFLNRMFDQLDCKVHDYYIIK